MEIIFYWQSTPTWNKQFCIYYFFKGRNALNWITLFRYSTVELIYFTNTYFKKYSKYNKQIIILNTS